MEIVENDGVYSVSGDITESCDLGGYNLPTGAVAFDMGGVRSINSCGVREWISWISKLNIQPKYRNCPQAVVMQFNMVREFLGNGAVVESFQLPAFNESTGEQKIFLLRSGVDFTPGEELEYDLPQPEDEDGEYESDVDFESYFYFIEELEAS